MILSPLSIAQLCASSNTQSPWRTGTKPSCKSSMIGLNVTLLTRPFLVTHDPQGFNNTEKKGKESHYFTILTDIPPVSINLSQTHISIVVGVPMGYSSYPRCLGGGGEGRGGEGRGGEGNNQVGITPDKKISITPDIIGAVSVSNHLKFFLHVQLKILVF